MSAADATMWERCAYALVVACRSCGAALGARCQTRFGREAGHPHAVRRDDALARDAKSARRVSGETETEGEEKSH